MNTLQYPHIVVKSAGFQYWHVVDGDGLLCHVTQNKQHALGVAKFLDDITTLPAKAW